MCVYVCVCVCVWLDVQWNYLAIKWLNLAIYNMMDPEDFMLSKVRQMEKDKYHDFTPRGI